MDHKCPGPVFHPSAFERITSDSGNIIPVVPGHFGFVCFFLFCLFVCLFPSVWILNVSRAPSAVNAVQPFAVVVVTVRPRRATVPPIWGFKPLLENKSGKSKTPKLPWEAVNTPAPSGGCRAAQGAPVTRAPPSPLPPVSCEKITSGCYDRDGDESGAFSVSRKHAALAARLSPPCLDASARPRTRRSKWKVWGGVCFFGH